MTDDAKMDEIVLIRTWYEIASAKQLAADHNVNDKWLLRAWMQLKRQGKLPEGDRPYTKTKTVKKSANNDDYIFTRDKPIRVPEDDPLLQRLHEFHMVVGDPPTIVEREQKEMNWPWG